MPQLLRSVSVHVFPSVETLHCLHPFCSSVAVRVPDPLVLDEHVLTELAPTTHVHVELSGRAADWMQVAKSVDTVPDCMHFRTRDWLPPW